MIKIVFIAIICAVVIIFLKNINSEFATLATIASGIILSLITFKYLSQTFKLIYEISNLSGIDNNLFKIIIKITVIGYITEFSCDLVGDLGLKSIADKIILIGKILILTLSMPIIYSVFELLSSFIK